MRLSRLLFIGICLLWQPVAGAAEIKVLTTIKPLQLIVEAVADGVDHVSVMNLVPVGSSAHHYALSPIDMTRLQLADLFYWVGPEMEVFIPKVSHHRVKKAIFALSDLPDIYVREFGSQDDQHDHDSDHQVGSRDLHLWLSPANAIVFAKHVAAHLSRLDAANKGKYEENLKVFENSILAFDQSAKQRLMNAKLKPYFVFHDTYGYFEELYGLKNVGVFSINKSLPPGIKQVAEIRERLQQTGESCIMYEPPMPPKLASTLTNGLPVKLIMLDVMGDFVEEGKDGYLQLLNGLVNGVLSCQ